MLQGFFNILKNKGLRNRILFTFALIGIYRIIAEIPLTVIDKSQLEQFFSNNQLFGLLDIFSGGALSNFSIGLMGVGPYITASIVMQLLTYVVPQLENLRKEGQQGQQIITQYTRLLTVPFGFVQSFGLISLLRTQGIVTSLTPFELLSVIIVSTAASVFLMWIGEIITEKGIGNGISLIITAGIIASYPTQISNTYQLLASDEAIDTAQLLGLIGFVGISILTVVFIVFMNDAIRKVQVSYARKIASRRTGSVVDTFLPIKLNVAGVIPIIFALSIIVFPGIVARYIATNVNNAIVQRYAENIYTFLSPESFGYALVYFFLVVGFTYFYTSIVFKPSDVSENLQKQGGFVPGIRPGAQTKNYLESIVQKLTFPGSLFLGIIAILPFIVQELTDINTLIVGGTGLLIVVSVILDTASQVRAQLISGNYDSYGA